MLRHSAHTDTHNNYHLLCHSFHAQPIGPVIDISRLPRYGVLAPPLPRPGPKSNPLVEYDRATGVFTRNKGTLRAALEHKTGGCWTCMGVWRGVCV